MFYPPNTKRCKYQSKLQLSPFSPLLAWCSLAFWRPHGYFDLYFHMLLFVNLGFWFSGTGEGLGEKERKHKSSYVINTDINWYHNFWSLLVFTVDSFTGGLIHYLEIPCLSLGSLLAAFLMTMIHSLAGCIYSLQTQILLDHLHFSLFHW